MVSGPRAEVVVVGHVGRDLVLPVEALPQADRTVPAGGRVEQPGGKGYQQALGLTQLGHRAAVVAAVGDDRAGAWVRACAEGDGIVTSGLTTRPGARTALVVSLVAGRDWHYVEDLPPATFAEPADVQESRGLIEAAAVTCLQLQEPWEAVMAAARLAKGSDRMVVADGSPDPAAPTEQLLSQVDVLRLDGTEASVLVGSAVTTCDAALAAAQALRRRGPTVVVVAAGEGGNAVAWPGGTAVVPLSSVDVVDSTGGGDALVAGLVSGVLSGLDPLLAACTGVAAAGMVVSHLGGRPVLDVARVGDEAVRLYQQARKS